MAELFLELFTEEIPYGLQVDARSNLKKNIEIFFEQKQIKCKHVTTFSTPKRLVLFAEGLPISIEQKGEEIRGPRVNAPQKAIEGFVKSHNVQKENVTVKSISKSQTH